MNYITNFYLQDPSTWLDNSHREKRSTAWHAVSLTQGVVLSVLGGEETFLFVGSAIIQACFTWIFILPFLSSSPTQKEIIKFQEIVF